MTAIELDNIKEMYVRAFMKETDSDFINDLVRYYLSRIRKRESDSDFYNDEESLLEFKQSVQEAEEGLAREVSLDDVKQMLGL